MHADEHSLLWPRMSMLLLLTVEQVQHKKSLTWEQLKAMTERQVDTEYKSRKMWFLSPLCCTALCRHRTGPQLLGGTVGAQHTGAPEFKCRPENRSMLLLEISFTSMCCLIFIFFIISVFFYFGKKRRNTVVTEGSRLSVAGWWKDLWTLTLDAVANSNCSSFQSCTHTRVGVTESNQCDYWRSDGFQSLWMVATLFL